MDSGEGRTCGQSGSRSEQERSLFGRIRSQGVAGRGVTPLVANILMVAVVLIIAMLVTVFAFGILDGASNQLPVASFNEDRGSDGQVSLVHVGGDSVKVDRLEVIFGDRRYPARSYVSSDQISAGLSIGPISPNGAEEIKLIWKDQDSSEVLYRSEVTDEALIPSYHRFEDIHIGSYGASQDRDGDYKYTTGSRTLILENNAWKYIHFEREYTSSSVLSFDFKSTDEGEIHGIGLENDKSPSPGRIFKLFGIQNGWASQYGSYSTSDGWVHYEIPVGELYSGAELNNAAYLAFVNDLDDGSKTSNSQFRNIRVYNTSSTKLSLTIDGSTEERLIQGYGSQDADGAYEIQDDGDTLRLTNNTWKYVSADISITSQAKISFEFKSTSEGEIHAIGFETDGNEDQSRFVTLDGTQNWGVSYGTYQTGDGWVKYEFNIDAQTVLAGTDISRIVFVNDDDSDSDGVSQFRNVTISNAG